MKRDPKSAEVIGSSGIMEHCMRELEKRTIVECSKKSSRREEGVSIREKTLMMSIMKMVVRRRQGQGDEEQLGKIADEIENE